MHIHIITIGSPKKLFLKEGFIFYRKRLEQFYPTEVTHLKENKNTEQKLLTLMASDGYNILLDEHGKMLSSKAWSVFLKERIDDGVPSLRFFVGGADGHSQKVLQHADFIWSMSPLTFPHEIALLLLTESLYRSATLHAHHPYHRE